MRNGEIIEKKKSSIIFPIIFFNKLLVKFFGKQKIYIILKNCGAVGLFILIIFVLSF